MTDFRNLLVASLLGSNMTGSPLHETALDRIGALAFADPLGAAAFRAKYCRDHREIRHAHQLLTKRVRRHTDNRHAVARVCALVLDEWLDDNCHSCSGRGHAVVVGVPVSGKACPTCGGTGKRPVSEQRRAVRLGIPVAAYLRWVAKCNRAELTLANAESAVWRELAFQLERGVGASDALRAIAFLRNRATLVGGGRSSTVAASAHNSYTMLPPPAHIPGFAMPARP